jgi:hypothetical protein
MKTSRASVLGFLAACSVLLPVFAQSSTPPPLGLLRLRSVSTFAVPSIVTASSYTVDDLTPGISGGNKTQNRGVDCIALAAQQAWSRPLRGAGQQVVFVSFSAYASLSTIIRVGGAWLGVTAGTGAGYAQLMVGQPGSGGINWQPVGVNFLLQNFENKYLADLSVLTVRLNPTASTWDLFYGSKLVAEDLPFYTPTVQTNSPDFVVTPGSLGAWVTGLVMSDENPFYVDANANSIADSFEQQQNSALLPANASAATHHAMAQAWRNYNRTHSTPALFVRRILPDHL